MKTAAQWPRAGMESPVPMPTNRRMNVRGKRLVTTALLMALAAGVAGCGTSKLTTGSIGRTSGKPLETMSASELHSATTRLGESYAKNPNDKRLAMNFAAALQMDGEVNVGLLGAPVGEGRMVAARSVEVGEIELHPALAFAAHGDDPRR